MHIFRFTVLAFILRAHGAKDCNEASSAIISIASYAASVPSDVLPGEVSTTSGIGRIGSPMTAPSRSRFSGNVTGSCPAYTPSPLTRTKLLEPVPSYAMTLTTTVLAPIIYTQTISTAAIVFADAPVNTTITQTLEPYTLTTVSVVPAQTTVTVARPANFTPVKCQPEYWQSTTTVTSQPTFVDHLTTSSLTQYISNSTSTTTSTAITGTVTILLNSDTTAFTFTQPLFTVTTTRNEPTSTIYEACATDNVVTDRAYGGYFNGVSPVQRADFSPLTTIVVTPAFDAVDCCSQCQVCEESDTNRKLTKKANSTCVGSQYSGPQNFTGQCQLFYKTNIIDQICDPDFSGMITGPPIVAKDYYISNGACGQLAYGEESQYFVVAN